MRSDSIFAAAAHIPSRYKLCQATAQATRRLHVAATRTQDTTNQVLIDIGRGTYGEFVKPQTPPPPPATTEVDLISA